VLLSRISKIFKKPYFSLSTIFISWAVLASTLLLSISEKCFGATYYVATNGNDQNSGSLSSPWRTIETSIAKLRPGDTLYLRGGTYYESQIAINVSGTPSNRILIKNYQSEVPVIDGGFRDFRRTSNKHWEVYDSSKSIYRSVRTYHNAMGVHGYFGRQDGNYRLVSYRRYNDLSANNEDYTNVGDIYIGPGIFWNSTDERIYIRLKPSSQAISMGYNIPSNMDPRSVVMYIFPCHEVITFGERCSYVDMVGINLRYQNNALEFRTGSHHISITNSSITCGRAAVYIHDNVHDLVFDGISVNDNVPPWIAYSDVKIGNCPGGSFQGGPLNFQNLANNIEVRNCLFRKTWDGIVAGNAFNLHIHHNTFEGTRDDVVQLGSACYDIEINHNKMLFVSKGPSRHGTGSSLKPGTKYIHHNIIDCSKSMLGGRNDPNNLLNRKYHGPNGDGMVWARPFSRHEGNDYRTADPWKIYNNTIVFGKELNSAGAGHEYTERSFYPNNPQEVYNNIIIQTMDHWLARGVRVSDGSQIHDGNIYYRQFANPRNYFLRLWEDGNSTSNFRGLSEFSASQCFTDSKEYYSRGFEDAGVEADPHLDGNYYPDPNGPAADGAVPLPTDWPGQDYGDYRGALPPLN
jgi:hypothetical protein